MDQTVFTFTQIKIDPMSPYVRNLYFPEGYGMQESSSTWPAPSRASGILPHSAAANGLSDRLQLGWDHRR